MIILATVLGILIGLILILLLVNFTFRVDSRNHTISFSFTRSIKAVAHWINNEVVLKLRVLFFRKDIYPMRWGFKATDKNSRNRRRKKKGRRSMVKLAKVEQLALSCLQSFTIKEFTCNIDTDNFILNSYLFPLFFLMPPGNNCQINFQGKFEFVLEVRNSFFRLLREYVKFRLT